MDFTCKKYTELLKSLISHNYVFQTFEQYIEQPHEKVVILRHDVDKHPKNALKIAQIEHELGIVSSYMFRISKASNDPAIISQIVRFGHELGYHYEDLSSAAKNLRKMRFGLLTDKDYHKKLHSVAIILFRKNLEYFRQFYPVKVISMHGSPLSRYDSRNIWKYYSYKEMGIICEPYFDVNHEDTLYLTDTGRRWDADIYNIRDKGLTSNNSLTNARNSKDLQMPDDKDWVSFRLPGSMMQMTQKSHELHNRHRFRFSDDIILAALENKLPCKLIINTHPQRWTDDIIPWFGELIFQNVKNLIKYFIKYSR